MQKYIVWLKLASGQVQTHKVEANHLHGAVVEALQDGRALGNTKDTRAIFACEEGVA